MASSQKNKKNPFKFLMNAGLAFMSLSLVGCMGKDLYEPSTTNDTKVQVKQEAFLQDVAIHDVDNEYIDTLARHYTKHGGSTMDLIVTYDPRSYRNTAMTATNKVADITAALRDQGVSSVKAGVMPIKSQGDHARLLVSYDAYTAHAPKGCDYEMPGITNNSPLEDDQKYKLGCAIDTMVARQIAKPGHLLGRGSQGGNIDGRPTGNIVDTYRTGAPNELLEGQSASEE